MVQRYYAYAISPLDNYEWTMRHRSLWRHRYLDWKCYYVYSYLRRNQKKLSFEKSYKNITGSSLYSVASTINTIQNSKNIDFEFPVPLMEAESLSEFD